MTAEKAPLFMLDVKPIEFMVAETLEFQITNQFEEKHDLLVALDSSYFKLLNPTAQWLAKSQIFTQIDGRKTIKMTIGVRNRWSLTDIHGNMSINNHYDYMTHFEEGKIRICHRVEKSDSWKYNMKKWEAQPEKERTKAWTLCSDFAVISRQVRPYNTDGYHHLEVIETEEAFQRLRVRMEKVEKLEENLKKLKEINEKHDSCCCVIL